MSNNSVSITDAINEALSMPSGELCRICGKMITKEQEEDAVFAGYSADKVSRSAHGNCWRSNTPKSEWAYPIDDNT